MEEIKKGTKVKIIGNSNNHTLKIGSYYIITGKTFYDPNMFVTRDDEGLRLYIERRDMIIAGKKRLWKY